MREATCRRCGVAVWWGETAKGAHVPVELERPRFGGKVVALDPDSDTPLIRFLKKGEEPPAGSVRWASHLGKCKPAPNGGPPAG